MDRLSAEDARKKHNPPLSFIDKLIYYSILFSLLIPMVSFLLQAENFQRYLAFSNDSSVFACEPRFIAIAGVAAICLYLTITAVVCVLLPLEAKKPIFGNKKIQYRPSDYYPIFGEQSKGVASSSERKRKFIKFAIIWLALFIVLLAVLPFLYQSRRCLDKYDGIVSYNVFNQKTEESYSMEDFSKVNIGARYVKKSKGGSHWDWFVEIKTVDGKIFQFNKKDFSYGFFRPDYEEGLKK